ncbi:hypothetical protein HYW35_02945 [Candidatus Saccharibacteria bacterium]|nr:hypothetical protein [Candidatus Saccharibacteria bacterium]
MSSSPEAIDPPNNGHAKPDTKWGVPGYVFSLETDDLEGDGVLVEKYLRRSGQPVRAGGGVLADRHYAKPHVEYVIDQPELSPRARERLIKHGHHLIRGELQD